MTNLDRLTAILASFTDPTVVALLSPSDMAILVQIQARGQRRLSKFTTLLDERDDLTEALAPSVL